MFFSKKNRTIKLSGLIFLGIFCVCLNFTQADTPDAPSNISIIASCQGNDSIITITWEHIFSQDVVDYYIYRDGVKVGWNFIIEEAEGVFLSWTDYSTVSSDTYTYHIRAINGSSELSNSSVEISKTAPFCPLPTLSLSTECYGLSPQIRLDWTIPNNVNYIDLYRSNNFCIANTGTNCNTDADCPSGDACFSWINQFPNAYYYWVNKNLDNSQNYTYYIKVSGEGWSSESDKNSITTLNCVDSIDPSPPPELTIAPTCIEEAGLFIKTMVLGWTRSENIDKYIIHKDSSEGYYIQDNIAQSDSPSYNDSGSIGVLGEIVKDRIYTYRIEAKNNNPGSMSAYSASTTVVFTEDCFEQFPPGDPVNLASESRCNGVDPIMRISWDAPATGGSVNNYVIYRSVNNGVFNYYISIADTFYDDPNVIIGNIAGYYKYQIEARGIGGSSSEPFPEIDSKEVSNCVPPVSPTIETPVLYCSTEENPFIGIEWSQGGSVDPDTDYFNIYRKLESEEWDLVESTANNSIYLWYDYGVASNIPSNNYFYYVKAVGFGAGDSVSGSESVAVGWCDPTVPTVSLSKICDGSGDSLIKINWAASKNLDHYEVRRDGTELIYSGTDTSCQDAVSGAIDDYSYEVKAVGKNGTGVIDTESITTDDCAILTGAPNIDAVNSESRCESSYYPYFHLEWDAVSNAEYYQVYRLKNEIGEVEELIYTSPNGTTISYDDTPANNPSILRVESEAGYYYRAVAIKAGVSSENSDSVLFSISWCPPSSPLNPQDVQTCDVAQPIVDIAWDESLNTANYEIYRKNNNSPIILSDIPIGTNNVNSYSDNTATEGIIYYYTIRAVGRDGSNAADSAAYEINVGYCQAPNQSQISLVSSCSGSNPYVGLSWTAISDAENYNIHKVQGTSIIPDAGNLLSEGTVLLSYNDNAVASGNNYSYVSLACNLGGCSSYNSPLDVRESIYVEYCVPQIQAPYATPSCDGLGNSVVNLNWTDDTTGNLDYYRVARDVGGTGFIVLVDNLANTADVYTNNQNNPSSPAYPPADSTNYTYYLTTVGYNGDWATSTANVSTYDCALPDEPTITTLSAACDNFYPYVYLDWDDVLDFSTDAQDKYYEIQQNETTIFNTHDIIGMWHFNNNANDESVYGNTATINGASWTAGKFNSALSFDGGNDYVNIPSNLGDPNEMSIEFWFFVSEGNKNRTQYFMDGRNGGNWWFLQSYNPNGTGNINFYNRVRVESDQWTAGQWNHLILTLNASASRIYINGELKAAGTGLNPDIGSNMRIGTRYTNTDYFRGFIDEVVIYNRVLSENEVIGYYSRGEHLHPTASEYYDYSVESANSYNYTVVAGNYSGESSDSDGPILINWCPPCPPANLSALKECDGLGNSEVTLSWDANSLDAVNNYQIIRTNGGTTVLENNLNGSAASYFDAGLSSNSITYTYDVAAIGKDGSHATSSVAVTTDNCSLPNADPNIFTATSSCDNSIPYSYLGWDAVSNADYYEIYRDTVKIASTQDIIALWHFNESGNVSYDETDNNNDANLKNGVSRAADQWGGNSLSFDGTNDYVAIENLHYSSVGEISELTVCAWIKTVDDGNSLIIDFDRSEYWALGINFQGASGGDGMISWDTTSSGGSTNDMLSTIRVDDDNWHYICGVFNSSEIYDKKIYIDGILYNKIDSYSTGVRLGTGITRYGFIGDGSEASSYDGGRNGNYFNGLIDEAKISDRALSGAEILADYQAGELNYPSQTANSYKDYNIISAATGIYLGRNFDYYIRACNTGGCSQGTSGNIFFNNPNSACKPFTTVLVESDISCVAGGMGVLDAVADLRWYDLFPDSASNYEVLIDGNSTSTTAENYSSSYEKEYIDYEKELDESFEGSTYSFVLRTNPKNSIFGSIGSNPISLGVPNCGAPSKPILEELIPSCEGDQPKISLNWEDDSDTDYYEVYSAKEVGGVPGIWETIEYSLVQSEYTHYSNNAFLPVELNTKYYYYVKAFGNSGSYNISDTVSTTTLLACYNAPLKPVISSVTGDCDNSSPKKPYVEIKWDRQIEDNNTDYYEIWRTDQGTRLNIVDILDNKDSFNSYDYTGIDSKGIDSDIVTNVQYQYYLIGMGPGGSNQSENSEFITAPDCYATPETPGNFSVVADCYGYCNGGGDDGKACNNDSDCDSNSCIISFIDGASMELNWDRTSNTFQYIVWKDCGDGYNYDSTIDEVGYNNYDPNNPDISYATSSITYITHLSEEYIGEDCFYDVKAVGWGGVSTSTDLTGDTVKVCGNTPMVAQSFNFGDINCEDVTLTWTDGTDIGYIGDGSDESAGEFYFQIHRADGAGCVNYIDVSGDLPPSNQSAARSYTDSLGLNEENDYCWKIVSWNPAGSATTSSITVKTPKCPPGQSVLQKDLLSCEKISLKWKRSENYLFRENATAYEIYSGTKISPKEILEETLPSCRCVDYSAHGGCSGFSTINDGIGAGNCDSDNNLFCADINNCCHTDCDPAFFCDGSGSQLKCYDLFNKEYYYREINLDGFTPSGVYYYILEVEPLEVGLGTIDSNQLKIQPCPGLPEWREVGF